MNAASNLRLLPNHLDDLHRSGLSDETLAAWGCFSIDVPDVALLNGFGKGVTPPGLALPILSPGSLEPVGFAYKPDCPRQLGKGGKVRPCKYEFARRALNQIHVPRPAQWLFRPPDGREGPMRMVITEGQKKAEKAAQEGIGCIALPGVWNWLTNFGGESVPIEQLAQIEWSRYAVEICFDSDAATNPNVRRAERALARWLRSRGAVKVSVVRFPPGGDGAKVGLDDYLIAHSAADFEALPRLDADDLPLSEALEMLSAETDKKQRNEILGRILVEERDPAEQERLLKDAAKRTKISLRATRSSAEFAAVALRQQEAERNPPQPPSPEDLREMQQAAVEAILDEAQRKVTLRAQTYVHGQLVYACCFGEKRIVLLNSRGEALTAAALPPGVSITEPPPDRPPMSPDGVRRFTAGDGVLAPALFDSLLSFYARHAIFKHPSVPTGLALWTMGTYAYSLFNYYGYLWFTSLGPSHGKSLVEKMLSLLCFNATAPITVPTPATLFRDTEGNAGTLILDEIENLDPEKKGDILAILNAGFERGGVVPRAEPAGDRFVIRRFAVYCPKAIAGISYLPRTLHTRVLQIDMPKRKANEQIESFEPDALAPWAEKIRDGLAIFALRNASKIAEMYAGRTKLVPRSIDDRLRDILAPLYAIAAVVDLEAGCMAATPELDRFAALQAGTRSSDPTGEDYAVAAHALFEWAAARWQEAKVVIRTAEAIQLFRTAEIDWATEPPKAKSLLKRLGGRNKPSWWGGETVRGWVFRQSDLQDLVERHPIQEEIAICEKQKR